MTLNPWLSLNRISVHAAPAHRRLKNNFSVADDPGAMDKQMIESHPLKRSGSWPFQISKRASFRTGHGAPKEW
jgi:hypothetical protein